MVGETAIPRTNPSVAQSRCCCDAIIGAAEPTREYLSELQALTQPLLGFLYMLGISFLPPPASSAAALFPSPRGSLHWRLSPLPPPAFNVLSWELEMLGWIQGWFDAAPRSGPGHASVGCNRSDLPTHTL